MIDQFRGEYRFLSNFEQSAVTFERLTFSSVEAAYQAMKSSNPLVWKSFTTLGAGDAKRAGRQLDLRDGWDDLKLDFMRVLLRRKFKAPALRRMLIETGYNDLVEGNTWHDNYWGDCRCGKDECDLPGLNWLGALLMELRRELVQEAMAPCG